MQETWVWSLCWGDPLEKGKSMDCIVHRVPKVRHNWATFTFTINPEVELLCHMLTLYSVSWGTTILFYTVKVKVKSLSCVWLFETPWTAAHQATPSMRFSRQEYWSGLPFSSPRDLLDLGIRPKSPSLQADALTPQPILFCFTQFSSLCPTLCNPMNRSMQRLPVHH